MQYATFLGTDTTRGTGDGEYLFWREFLLFHCGKLLEDMLQILFNMEQLEINLGG
jgi:hypothetical protein